MESLTDLLQYLNPKVLIDTLLEWLGVYVYFGLIFIIFAETGLAVGFFLPGDSLLVVAGLFAAAGKLNLWIMIASLFAAAVLGDAVGSIPDERSDRQFSADLNRDFSARTISKGTCIL